ncbi:amino acid adenylation domain-containing protein [Xenorhabdus budapestensis]|uniref:Amino acid adenylation domain-containing protein n=1 Tax=Xenorhabdus budapestensis TaxID=290110 RepID=A0ABX7VBE4_XENBU|nr:non-ribosomal peptide synthetase [Xenorhabdus budapestensis]QTL38231.1 amino acid adenylation domain-containing protein [Xenorhabdus budapestensis]
MNINELNSLPLAEREKLLESAKAAKLTRQYTQRTSITVQPREGDIPLSWAQQRLWFLTQLDPAAQTAYHMSTGLHLQGLLNQNALKAALDRIVARHEILRTTFVSIEGTARQVIGDANCGFALTTEDISHLPASEKQTTVEKCAQHEAITSFDFTQGPLFRGHLLRLAEDEHILLLTQHHIISDGWSVNVLIYELSTLYHAFCQGLVDPLPGLPLQYTDYTLWQHQWLQGNVLENLLNYWRNELQSAPVLLELPTDKPRPIKQSYIGNRVNVAFSPTLSSALKALSQHHGTTLFMTLLAGWSVLLSRLSGQHDLVIGTPVANRQQHELEPLIGFFVNTLALRIQLSDNPSVSELLNRVKHKALSAYAHQDLPFEQLVEVLKPPRNLSHSPIFQVMLALDNTPGQQNFELSGLHVKELSHIRNSAYFDLTLSLNDTDQGLVGDLEYSSDIFEHASIERMVGHLQTLLEAMIADDSQQIETLPLLTSSQRSQLLTNFNLTAQDYQQDRLIHQLVEQQAASRPDAIALIGEEGQLSYAELNQHANQLAHAIRASGVRPDERIAICVERSLEMIIGLLGILKAGASYVPLDPEHPTERLVYMLSDSQPALILTQRHLSARLVNTDLPIWALDSTEHQTHIASHPQDNISITQSGLIPSNLAYVLYTSGSTGLPKGVMIEHRHVVNFIQAQIQTTALTSHDRVLQFASFGFDNSVAEIFPTLAVGATLVLRPAHLKVPDTDFITFLQENHITVVDLPTAFWHLWAQEVKAGYSWPPPSLRSVAASGEKAEARHLKAWLASPGTQTCRWINFYGPTETTVNATACIYEPGHPHSVEDIPIGRPMANTTAYILDTQGQPVPIGVTGELYIGGEGVARGYLNRTELTAERFIHDPFSNQPAARLYRTGDLGRWLPDGNIRYLGRNDFQIKLRGFRIELGEIETQLVACTGVKDALVIVREDDSGDKRLIAYLVPDSPSPLNTASLREQLSSNLASYMIPTAFVTLEAFPLNQSGKVDRAALPAPNRSASVSHEYAAPQGEIEQQLAEIWQSLLGLEQVGRHDNFFELGGHSLLTVQVASRLRQTLNINVTLQDLFLQPTLSDLAQTLVVETQSIQPDIVPVSRQEPLPLSWAQQRLWFLAQLDPAAQTAYYVSGGLHLHGALDLPALTAALDRIVARHEILRTTFRLIDGQARQIIGKPDSGFALTVHDFSQLPAAGQHAAIEAAAEWDASHPFDFSTGPLIRAQLLKLADHQHRLLLTQHHIITDGWSLNILLHELSTLYQAFTRGQPDPLPPLPVQYADYALWQRQWLQGTVLDTQLAFWRQALHGIPALLALPTDHARPAVQSYRGDQVPFTLSPPLVAALKALSQRHGTTLFMTLLTGWGILLARLSGQPDIVIGTPVANRQHSALEPLIGFFVNTLALRVTVDDNPTVQTLLARVKTHTVAAYAHQDLPFEQLVEALQPPRSLSHSPLFQVMFALDNTPKNHRFDLPGLTLTEVPAARNNAQFDLTLSLNETAAGITGDLEYATDLFERATIERLSGYLTRLLTAMAADDRQPVGSLPLLTPAQRRQLLTQFNATARAYPREPLIHQLIEQQAAATPAALALVSEAGQLSYADLNRHANQLAHALRAAGARPDDRIALCAERSLSLIIGMLAILKAGASYVPLDPDYPTDRLTYMLADSQPVLVLTQRHLSARLANTDLPLWVLDSADHHTHLASQPQDNIPITVSGLTPANLAYVLYTSGSTGLPKGVMIEHRQVVNFIQAQIQLTALTPRDRVLQFASFGFDNSVAEIFPTLAVGATLVLRPARLKVPDTDFMAFLHEHHITVVDLPTAFWHLWAQEVRAGHSGPPPALRSVAASGEKAEVRHLQAWLASPATQACRWINIYGPTETTVNATACPYEPGHPAPADDIPIGRPMANTTVYILDPQGQPVPVGVTGELYIGGEGVARGYLHRPDLTAERFLPDPFRPEPAARMYRTGDLGYWRPEGTIHYLGRNDFQVKLRGFRIELGEIETQLVACPGVKDALVIVREDDPGDKRLVAYLVPDAPRPLDATRLRDQLSQHLASYMIPSAFVTLDAFPLNPSGKIDRRALPAPDRAARVSRDYVAPQGGAERQLAAIWQALLRLAQVGRHDNFFELGGHSLLVVTLIEQLRQHHWTLPVSAVFAAPTLAAMAQQLTHEPADSPLPDVPASLIPPDCPAITPAMLPLLTLTQAQIDPVVARVAGGARNVQDMYPLGPLQEGILFHYLLETRGDTYLDRQFIRFDSRPRLEAFLQALQQVIDRHDILRSAVHWQGLPEPVQVVYRQAPLPRTETVLAPGEAAEQQLRRLTDTRLTRLDITRAPLLAATFAQEPGSAHWLLALQHHHLVCDHLSLDIIFSEMQALLAGQGDTLPPSLPYRHFIAQTRAVPAETHQAYFRQLLGDMAEPTLPFGLADTQNLPADITEAVMPLDNALSQQITACARQQGVSAAVLFHVAWAQVLALCSGQDDIVFGTVLLGRLQGGAGTAQIFGMLINTLPVRIALQDRTVQQTVQATHQQLSALLAHEQTPLALAQRCSGIPAPQPLFSSLLNFRHSQRDPGPAASPAWAGIQILAGEEHSNYPLSLDVDAFEDGFALTAQCPQHLNPARINHYMVSALSQLVSALHTAPARAIRSLTILPDEERTRLLVAFNPAAVTAAPAGLLHQAVEQQAARTPAATALVWGDTSLSYAALNRRANQLAHALIAAGVRPDDRVAIYAERSVTLMIGLLAILKAGAGYVPLATDHPRERLAYLLSDSAPVLLLTQTHLHPHLPDTAVPTWCLDEARQQATLETSAAENPDPARLGLQPHHLAYVIYTSGSTGLPKGVMIEHRNVTSFVAAQLQANPLTARDRVLQFTAVAFDTAVSEIFPTFAAGASLILRPDALQVPDSAFSAFLHAQKITALDVPAAFWHLWVQELAAGRCPFSPYLRTVTVGGEKVEARHLQTWQALPETQPCRWFNAYGPTETTVTATAWAGDNAGPAPHRPALTAAVPIGRPLANSKIYILDAHGQPVPVGVTGEIYVGGAGVARGYLHRPDLTAERFIRDPFSAQPGARMYRTGDLGQWLPEGNIHYLGRNDFQVKIRGFRIELGEIETQLAACPGVKDAVVIARENTTGDQYLVAYLIPQPNISLDPNELREQLSRHLMEYMLPQAYMILDTLPLTANGKLDRQALPAPDRSSIAVHTYEIPQGEIEQQLATIWQDLLGLDQAGRHDDFFVLGGNSLSIMQLSRRLRNTFHLDISVADIFRHSTLSQLAELISSIQQDISSIQQELDDLSEDELLAMLRED